MMCKYIFFFQSIIRSDSVLLFQFSKVYVVPVDKVEGAGGLRLLNRQHSSTSTQGFERAFYQLTILTLNN